MSLKFVHVLLISNIELKCECVLVGRDQGECAELPLHTGCMAGNYIFSAQGTQLDLCIIGIILSMRTWKSCVLVGVDDIERGRLG